jgi:hypothetical protein
VIYVSKKKRQAKLTSITRSRKDKYKKPNPPKKCCSPGAKVSGQYVWLELLVVRKQKHYADYSAEALEAYIGDATTRDCSLRSTRYNTTKLR